MDRSKGALALGLAAAIGLPLPGQAQKSEPHAPGAKGAFGRVLNYKEAPSGNILYLEETGTVRSPNQRPVEGSRRDDMPDLAAARTPAAEAAPAKAAPPASASTGARKR